MARAILGYKDIETTMRRVYIFEAIKKKVKSSEQARLGLGADLQDFIWLLPKNFSFISVGLPPEKSDV